MILDYGFGTMTATTVIILSETFNGKTEPDTGIKPSFDYSISCSSSMETLKSASGDLTRDFPSIIVSTSG